MDNIKWIFFDLGHTLINEDFSQRKRIENAVDYLKEKGVNVSFNEFYSLVCKASREYKSPFVTAFNQLYDAGNHVFVPYPAEFEILYDDTEAVLKELTKKYKLAVIANQSKGTNERLKKFGIYDYFNFILASSDVGYSKPDLRIFQSAIIKASCKSCEAIMVGDRLDNDIVPAKKTGMGTVWIKQGYGGMQSIKEDDYKPDFTVASLNELLKIF